MNDLLNSKITALLSLIKPSKNRFIYQGKTKDGLYVYDTKITVRDGKYFLQNIEVMLPIKESITELSDIWMSNLPPFEGDKVNKRVYNKNIKIREIKDVYLKRIDNEVVLVDKYNVKIETALEDSDEYQVKINKSTR